MINNCRKNKTTIIGVGLLDPSSLSLYTITESQYLETINNDDNNNSSSCNSSTNNIRTISFADTDEGDEDYGLDAFNNSSSSIHLVSPLTQETISKKNGGGGNHGGRGTIKSVDKDGKVLEVVYKGQDEEDDY